MTTGILVTGSHGMLGTDLMELLKADSAVRAAGADIGEVDITDAVSVEECLELEQPDIVVNCAAYTNVDGSESQEGTARAVNALGPELLARACDARKIRLVHVSTDYVFDGRKTAPYLTDDEPCPLGVYGRSKLAGERAVAVNCSNHLIVRTAWLYGAHGPNFVTTMLRLARERDCLRVVSDQVGSPTFAKDLARLLRALALTDAVGITHATNAGSCSWYEFALEIVGLAGLDTPVQPISTAQYPTPARRPANTVLDCSRTDLLTGIERRHWRDALAQFIDQIERNAAS